MAEAYIVGAVRTPGGKKNGSLSKIHPADLGAKIIDELIKRTGIPADKVDDVIFGCVGQNGAQAGNVARNAILSSSLPESVPGTTVDRQCGSSQQAIHFAAQAVMSGTQDIVIAGGVEVMSLVPIGTNIIDSYKAGRGQPSNSEGMEQRYPGIKFSQFTGAEMIAKQWGMKKEDIDAFAYNSHKKAAEATNAGKFSNEIMPVDFVDEDGNAQTLSIDEGIRFDADLAAMSSLKTIAEGGVITAANASQITDGAAAIMIVNEKALKELGLTPRARIHTLSVVGDDPIKMLTGPIPATKKALERSGLSIDDIDLYEVNEAFAPVPMAWAQEVGADLNKLNVNGGACALGHPLGGTGAKLMTTLLHELERTGGKYGLQAICEGGGTANATIIERM
tara:strand:+ start:484 stop:1659 length:1176 start_codon:yes stop_codon:yes gene_type:complete